MGLEVNNLKIMKDPDGPNPHPVVCDLTFRLERSQTLALTGPSGSGKTTVALSILDLLPHALRLVQGQILLDGQSFTPSWRGLRIGLIFQEPRLAFNPSITVGRLMKERLTLAGVAKNRLQADCEKWFDLIGLESGSQRMNDYAHRFSGGELQRIMIAMCLAQGPDFLIADEPTSNLDVLVQGKILGLLKHLQDEFDLGILLITHDRRVAKAMASEEVSILREGSGQL